MRTRTRGLAVTFALLAGATACAGTNAAPVSETPAPSSTSTAAPPTTTPPPAPPTSTKSAKPPKPPGKPNILFLLTDDQTLSEMSALPQTSAYFKANGTTFTHALSQYPLCCPARATLLTGQQAHNHQVMGNDMPWGSYRKFDESQTLPLWLQKSGYQTGITGKYLNGYPLKEGPEYDPLYDDAVHVPVGWDDWRVPIKGIYDYYDFTINNNGELVEHNEYQTTYTKDTTEEMLTTMAADKRPFYLWSGFLAPHAGSPIESDDPRYSSGTSAVDTPAVDDIYKDTGVGIVEPKPSLTEGSLADKPKRFRGKTPIPLEDLSEKIAQREEALHSVDDAIASILATLEATGEADNTLVVFASDNGYLIGEHGLDQKIYGYEEAIRVPLMMSGPGVPAGVKRNQLVSLTDLSATFLDASGAKPAVTQDGISLLPLAQDGQDRADRSLLLEAGGWPYPKLDRLYTGVRTADGHVMLKWYDGTVEVYDLKTDPYQLNGEISKAERPLMPELRRKLDALKACVGEDCNSQ